MVPVLWLRLASNRKPQIGQYELVGMTEVVQTTSYRCVVGSASMAALRSHPQQGQPRPSVR